MITIKEYDMKVLSLMEDKEIAEVVRAVASFIENEEDITLEDNIADFLLQNITTRIKKKKRQAEAGRKNIKAYHERRSQEVKLEVVQKEEPLPNSDVKFIPDNNNNTPHDMFKQRMLSDTYLVEQICIKSNGCLTPQNIGSKIDEFNLLLRERGCVYTSESEYRSHLSNWINASLRRFREELQEVDFDAKFARAISNLSFERQQELKQSKDYVIKYGRTHRLDCQELLDAMLKYKMTYDEVGSAHRIYLPELPEVDIEELFTSKLWQ